MKTFTNYAEKKAKQFFNLLQGYTKGIRITAILILLLMGVSNAWAGGGIYLKPNSNWTKDNARFAAYFFKSSNNSDSKWMSMYASNKSGYYVCAIPDGYDMVIFCRMNGGNQTNDWNNKWNQTGNLNVPSDEEIVCSINSGQWDCGNNVTWSAINWYIVGDFNGWNTTANKMPCNISIESGNHTMKIVSEYGEWFGNTGTMIRGNSSGWTMTYGENSNCTLTADVAGTYNFSCTGTKLTVTYPEECFLKGNFNDWSNTHSILGGSVTIYLKAGTYEFKIHRYDETSDYWVSNDGTMTRDNCSGWTMSSEVNDDCKITADFDGDYTFTYDRSTGKLSVTYPTIYKVTYSHVPTDAADAPTSSISSGAYVLANTSLTFTAKTAKTGYTWKGWYSNNAGNGNALTANKDYTTAITANTTIYAVYTANTYTVELNQEGATTVGTESVTATYGAAMPNITPPTRTGYTFNGYFDATSGGTKYYNANGSSAKNWDKTSNTTLYAQWTANQYTITYKDQNNANFSGTHASGYPTTHTYGTATTLKDATKTGYTFDGWHTDAACTNKVTSLGATAYTANITLYAKWTINQKNVYLVGEFNWDTADGNKFEETSSGSGIYTLTKHFEARDRHQTTTQSQAEYEFKLNVDGTNYTVEGNTDYTQADKKILQYTRQSTTKVVSDGTNYQSDPYHNLLLQADMTGDYIFTYNAETKELTVTHPTYTPEASFIVGDFSDGATGTDALRKDGGAGHDWTEAYGQQFSNDNSATICFNGTNQTWEFKIKINGVWYGLKDLVITESGTYTLTNEYAYQSERNCAITTNGVNGCYEFSWIDKGNGTIDLTVGYPEPNNYPTTIYLKPNDDWKANNARFAVYYWDDENNNAWKDMTDVGCNGEYYQVEIPAAQVGIILCSMKGSTTTNDWNNKVYQTEDLYVPSDHKVLYDMESTNITHIYLTPNSNWKKDGAQFEAVFNDNSYKRMEKFDNNGTIYYCQSESGQVKFNRVNPNNGYDKWNYTHTLSIPTDGKNLYTITEGVWDEGDGSWSTIYDNSKWTTYTAPTYDVTINITGKGSVTIDGETYESTSEGTTTLTIEDLDVNTVKNVTAITPADRWDYQNNATIKIGNNDQATLACQNHTICGPTTINITFIQVQCLVSFDLNLPEGAEHIGIGEQIVTKGDTATEPATRTINGYMFGGWYTEAECTNKYDFSTAVTKDITLYARWAPYEECIFFKNNLNWNKIYIYTFNNEVWHNGNNQDDENDDMGVQPKINRIEFGQMTQIGYTDIYYYVLTKEDGFNRIAFSDYDMSGYNYFNKHSGIYRGDRQDHMQLFIPQKDQTPKKRNETQYYSSGLWMKYNSTYSGYDWSGQTTGSNWSHTQFTTDVTGGYSFTAEVPLTVGTNYEFKIWNINQDWYGNGGTMTQDNCTNWHFKTEDGSNAKITPTITGDYVFTVYLGDGKVMISLDYPLSVGDYRLAYQDNTHPFHPGHYIKKRSTIAEQRDTVSFFVHHDQSPKIYLQQCTAISAEGVPTWETQTTYTELGDAVSSTTVYNFVLKQTNSGDTHTCSVETGETHLYTGEFYIRTDAAGGGWKSFRQSGNKMTFSSYAQQNEHFDHYFCEWILAKENVKFTIANDYSYCISDTLDNDDIIEHDDVSTGCLPVDANVRFSWNSANNEIHRAYIAGSSYVADRFLVLEGNEYLKDDEGNILPAGEDNGSDPRYGLNIHEEVFGDMGNWIYQVDVTADVQTKAKLTALYNGVVQYFKGKEGDGDDAKIALLKSTATDTYKIRLIYDFKTNHLVSGWLIEDDTVEEDNAVLGANMMIIRHNQDPAEQLNFDPNSRTLTDVGIAYGVMTFDKYFLNNRDNTGNPLAESDSNYKSENERKFYWISFPFDVKLRDVFGFGEYGDQWIMEYYDGAERAAKGWWAETETFWKYITNLNYTLRKGQGYVLCLNLNKMNFESNIFQHTDNVSLYFPSTDSLHTITGVPIDYTAPNHTCTIERDNRNIYDSHWNLIGVPGFADIVIDDEIGNHLYKENPLLQDSVSFYYEYLPATNKYHTQTNTETFQTMYSYMVQYTGTISWSTPKFGDPALMAQRAGAMPDKYSLRLVLNQNGTEQDQTFVEMHEERATTAFDMNRDLAKMMNSGANIYTLTTEPAIMVAGNAIPMEATTVPVGVQVATAGEYTFRMPDGTDGIAVTLVDNVTGTHTNMLMNEYTVTLDAGTIENRFYLVVDPDRTATSVENVGSGANGDEAKGVEKFLIDGKLFIRTTDGIFDAKGQRL